MSKEEWQKKANENQNKKRKGIPTFAAVRFKTEESKKKIDSIVKRYPGTKEESLIAAYELLEKELNK